jgi:hypothetical protein
MRQAAHEWGPMHRSYSRRCGTYVYDISIHKPFTKTARFLAYVMNLEKLESGQHVFVNAAIPDEFGATAAEAVSHIDAAVEQWVKSQKPSG